MGFQRRSGKLTTEVTEITEGKKPLEETSRRRCRLVDILLIGRVGQANSFYLLYEDF
jgi:hypothetical protein